MWSCFQAPRAVHSSQNEPSVRAKLPEGVIEEKEGYFNVGRWPCHLLEAIFAHVGASDRRTQFSICGVNRTWRVVGRHLFFSSPWDSGFICHPSQVFCLSPRAVERSRSGLLQCYVRREARPAEGGLFKFSLLMGKDHKQPHRSHFLMSAVQVSRSEMLIYLNRDGRGGAAGRLTARNTLRTRYTLELAPGVKLLGDAYCERGYRQVKAAPTELWSLKYLAKMQGLMQPRRMEVRLPPPSRLFFGHVLPTLCREGGDLEASYHGGQPASHLFRGSYGPPPPACLARITAAATAGGWDAKQPHQPPGRATSSSGAGAPGAGAGVGPAAGQQAAQQQHQELKLPWQEQPLVLVNKPPEWNAELRCWCLNFRGRVKQASIKNFQLICQGDPSQRAVIQFGRIERDVFACDFNPTVLTACQALCMGLSTFGGKFLL